MDDLENICSIFKTIFIKANPIINISNLIKDFVEKGILEDSDALVQNVEADLEFLVCKLKPQLANMDCRFECLCIMENNGVCVHKCGHQHIQGIIGEKGIIKI